MTTVGLLCLAIARKHDKQSPGMDGAFEKGMAAFLGQNNFQDGKSVGYDLLTNAELGRFLGSVYFKSGERSKAWYREGAEKVVKLQQEDGSFKLGEQGIDKSLPVIGTACGLYFLGPPQK
jgi:hypothetical protein